MSEQTYKPLPGFQGSVDDYQQAVADTARAVFNTSSEGETEAALKRRAPQLAQAAINVAHVHDYLQHHMK